MDSSGFTSIDQEFVYDFSNQIKHEDFGNTDTATKDHLEESVDTLQSWFNNANCHRLLETEEEQTCYRAMSDACHRLLQALINDPRGEQIVRAWVVQTVNLQPKRGMFAEREPFNLLLREHAQLSEDTGAMALVQQAEANWQQHRDSGCLYTLLASANLPRTAVVGLADFALGGGHLKANPMAKAIDLWLALKPAALSPCKNGLREETRTEISAIMHSYLSARNTLVNHNLRLVTKIAMQYAGKRDLATLDFIQEGCTGLIRAAEKFDGNAGCRFSTYAYPWITQAVRRCQSGKNRLIRYPANIRTELDQLYRARVQAFEQDGRQAGLQELAAATGFSHEKIEDLLQLCDLTLSLDSPLAADSSELFVNTIVAPEQQSLEHKTHCDQISSKLMQQLSTLPENEQIVIKGRSGIGCDEKTLQQLSVELGVSREWVRQLENKGMRTLAKNQRLKTLFQDSRN